METKRLGLIVPSSNTTMETEYRSVLPEGFTLHTARVRLKEVTVEALIEMERGVEEEALKLADAHVDVIGYGCTSGSLVKGLGHDREIVARIEKTTGIPAVATAGAVVEALNALGVRRVAVATPYIDEINTLEKEFLEANGFEVVDIEGLKIVDNTRIGVVAGSEVIRLVRALRHDRASGVFVSCTNLPTTPVIERLETELRKPVVSSNTATLWSMLRKCRSSVGIRGLGRLFKPPQPSD